MANVRCRYPDCTNCDLPDCVICEEDVRKMQKALSMRSYRYSLKKSLPHCDKCEHCVFVQSDRGNEQKRLCWASKRLIEQRITASPVWCTLRQGR